jgi:lysozyme family protein
MARIEKLTIFILKWEGGFSNDSIDSGGITMKGVTLSAFQEYQSKNGLPAPTVSDLKNISDKEWLGILKSRWDAWKADSISSQFIANILVDWAWNSGSGTSIKQFQKLMGLSQDGIVGNQTLSAINNYQNKIELFNRILKARKDFYVNIVKQNPSQIKFLFGWLNRLYDNVNYCFNLIEKT